MGDMSTTECTGTRYYVNPDAPEEGTDIRHDGACEVHGIIGPQTIREALAPFGLDRIDMEHSRPAIDRVHPGGITVEFTGFDGGKLAHYCGGLSVMQLRAEVFRRMVPIAYVVVDDSAGQTWDVRRRDGRPTETHSRPVARLRLTIPG